MEKLIELEQALNMKGYLMDKVLRLPDGQLTTLVYKNYPLKDRFRERFYAPTQEDLIQLIQNKIL